MEDVIRKSGQVVVRFVDVDQDTYMAIVTSPAGMRHEAACLVPDEPADESPEGYDDAAAVILDISGENDGIGIDNEPVADIELDRYAERDDEGFFVVTRGDEVVEECAECGKVVPEGASETVIDHNGAPRVLCRECLANER